MARGCWWMILVASSGLTALGGCEPECEFPDAGAAVVEADAGLRFQIDSVGTNAIDELYLLEPRYLVLTEDAAQDIGAIIDLGELSICDELVFMLRSTVDASVDHDSLTSEAFRITRTDVNSWRIEVEDYEDDDYDDIVAHVYPS